MRRHVEACRVVIENTMILFFDMKFSGETRNSVGKARLAETVRCVSGRA